MPSSLWIPGGAEVKVHRAALKLPQVRDAKKNGWDLAISPVPSPAPKASPAKSEEKKSSASGGRRSSRK